MAECTLPIRDHHGAETTERLPIFTDVAHKWAVEVGYATELDNGDLRRADDIDTIGEAVVTIGNSERSVEDFGLVHKIIARANRGAVIVDHSILLKMVETADYMFGSTPEQPEPRVA